MEEEAEVEEETNFLRLFYFRMFDLEKAAPGAKKGSFPKSMRGARGKWEHNGFRELGVLGRRIGVFQIAHALVVGFSFLFVGCGISIRTLLVRSQHAT